MKLDDVIKGHASPEKAFVSAAANSNRAALQLLLGSGVSVDCVVTNLYQTTALHSAATVGSKATVDFLVNAGARLNELDGNQMTPLMNACSRGKKTGSQIALLLLDRGADATYVRTSDDMTAYTFALWGQCSPEVLAELIRAGARQPSAEFPGMHLVKER